MTRLLISADSHVRVPLDVIRERVPASLHKAFDDAISLQAAQERRLRGGKELDMSDWDMDAFRDPGYSDPVARLAAMDRDGVQAEVLYSEVSAFRHFGLVKGDWKPISRAFTDHLSEFASVDPKRLAVSYQVPIIDIDYAVTEVHRLAGLGARSVHLPNFPSELGLPDYHDVSYDPLWAALSETGMAISHHLGTAPYLYDVFQRDPTPQCGIFTSLPALTLAQVIAWWILTGTLERFPKLKIVFVEPSLYWVAGFIASLDRKAAGPYDFPGMKLKPSEYFRPQHGGHLHGRRVRAAPAPRARRREHPVVDRLPPPGDHVAELPGGGGTPVRRRARAGAGADLRRQRLPAVQPLNRDDLQSGSATGTGVHSSTVISKRAAGCTGYRRLAGQATVIDVRSGAVRVPD